MFPAYSTYILVHDPVGGMRAGPWHARPICRASAPQRGDPENPLIHGLCVCVDFAYKAPIIRHSQCVCPSLCSALYENMPSQARPPPQPHAPALTVRYVLQGCVRPRRSPAGACSCSARGCPPQCLVFVGSLTAFLGLAYSSK